MHAGSHGLLAFWEAMAREAHAAEIVDSVRLSPDDWGWIARTRGLVCDLLGAAERGEDARKAVADAIGAQPRQGRYIPPPKHARPRTEEERLGRWVEWNPRAAAQRIRELAATSV